MEERGAVAGVDNSHRWIVDPLDGTTNFLHGMPLFAISIGLEREGQLVAGVVYNPISDELFTAEKGKGAYLNDRRRLRVAARKNVSDALITIGIPHLGRPDGLFLKELPGVMKEVAGVRRTGSAALDLAWTAAGRFDAYWERGIQPWDMAAGIVLVREAGGVVSDFSGGGHHARKRSRCWPPTLRCKRALLAAGQARLGASLTLCPEGAVVGGRRARSCRFVLPKATGSHAVAEVRRAGRRKWPKSDRRTSRRPRSLHGR